MSDFNSWLGSVGFKRNPFERPVADNDEHLDEYFIQFPYYAHVLGQAQHPQTTFLLAERGGGKTANRIQIELHCQSSIIKPHKEERILGVSLIDFTTIREMEQVTLRDYIEGILKRAVPKFYETIFDPEINKEVKYSKKIGKLSPEDRYDLIYYLTTFSDRLSPQSLRLDVRKFQQLIPRAKSSVIEQATQSAVNLALEIIGQAEVPIASQLATSISSLFQLIGREEIEQIKTLERSPLDLMERFCDLISLFDIQCLYIIVDSVDEYAAANDLDTALELIRPLLEATRLLGLPRIGFKFFLPAELQTQIRQIVRTDRFPIYEAEWRPEDLELLLEKRLQAASGSRLEVQRLWEISTPNLRDKIDSALVKYSRSPRDLIRLGAWIFAEHGRGSQISSLITEDEFRRALNKYVHERIQEMARVGQGVLISDLAQIGKIKFSLSDAIARLNLPEDQALLFLRDCEKQGYINAIYEIADVYLQTYMSAVVDIQATMG